jgi:hypothetical protein
VTSVLSMSSEESNKEVGQKSCHGFDTLRTRRPSVTDSGARRCVVNTERREDIDG